MMRRVAHVLMLLALGACTLALPGDKGDAPVPLTTEAIEVTKLDAPKAGEKAGAATPPATAGTATPDTAATPAEPEPADPATEPETPAEVAPPPAPLSPAALACQKKGGRFIKTGSGDLRACVKVTADGGKACKRETDCTGSCLARSGTCAPVTPLFGCNEILQADGRRVTLCLD